MRRCLTWGAATGAGSGLVYALCAGLGPVCHNEPLDWAKVLHVAPYVLMLGLSLPLVFVLLVEPRLLRAVGYLLIAFTAHLPLSIVGCVAGESARSRNVGALLERCAPIIAAIDAFETRTGSPPGALAELGPLDPALARALDDENVVLEYTTSSHEHPNMRWRLLISMSGIEWLFHLPDEPYPSYFRGGPVRRIGDWARALT